MCKSEFIATGSWSETFPGLNVTSIDQTRCAFCIFPIHEQAQKRSTLEFHFQYVVPGLRYQKPSSQLQLMQH